MCRPTYDPTVMCSRLLAMTALTAVLLIGAAAHADGLSSGEADRLASGGTVTRTQELERGQRRYVGGVTYTIVDAGADELASLLDDVERWKRILPRTRGARHVGSAGGDVLVEVTHGWALVQYVYTMRMRRDGNVTRFWMDPFRRHDIEDAWGFFRAEPLLGGRTLVTFGILIDVGPGLLRDLFEDRVRELALTIPQRVRALLLERKSAESKESLVTGADARY
jgi:hypothetical protein